MHREFTLLISRVPRGFDMKRFQSCPGVIEIFPLRRAADAANPEVRFRQSEARRGSITLRPVQGRHDRRGLHLRMTVWRCQTTPFSRRPPRHWLSAKGLIELYDW